MDGNGRSFTQEKERVGKGDFWGCRRRLYPAIPLSITLCSFYRK
jgi:hypothetical protein